MDDVATSGMPEPTISQAIDNSEQKSKVHDATDVSYPDNSQNNLLIQPPVPVDDNPMVLPPIGNVVSEEP